MSTDALWRLIAEMEPALQPGEYVFVSIPRERRPDLRVQPLLEFLEDEGLTLILEAEEARRCKLPGRYKCRRITLGVFSPLEAVGLIAAASSCLAQTGISVNAVSAYHHDHFFVPVEHAPHALQLLSELAAEAQQKIAEPAGPRPDEVVFSGSGKKPGQVVLFHGTGGHPEANWLPWLTAMLRSRAITVRVPCFPTPEGQSLENWKRAFVEQIGALDEDMVLIGHSMGCGMILRLLEEAEHPVHSVYLAAGWTGLLGNPDFDPLISSFFTQPFNWERVRKAAQAFFLYHGENDPYVPLRLGRELAQSLRAKLNIIPDGGHLNTASGHVKFDLLLRDVLRDFGVLAEIEDSAGTGPAAGR